MSHTTNLMLPYLAAGQAQKHVTLNESLRRLDAVVQLSVASATTPAQPESPADGAAWILPMDKSGAQWAAMTEGALAYYRDGAWEQILPRQGWLAFIRDEGAFVYFDGAEWLPIPGGEGSGASDADDIGFDPSGLGTITAEDVQGALEELDAALEGLSGGGDAYTDEQAQDAAAALFIPDEGDIDFTYTDATPSIAATIKPGAVGATQIADDAVSFAKLLNATQASFVGATSAGSFSELTPAQARGLAGLDTGDSPQFASVNLGHASDTTLSRSAAGVASVEGVDLGWMDAPVRSISAADTFALTDRGKTLYHPASDTSARTWTIPANASVAFPVGSVIVLINENGAGVITLQITSDTLRWGSSTGSRTLAANAVATLIKVSATLWRLSGEGVS